MPLYQSQPHQASYSSTQSLGTYYANDLSPSEKSTFSLTGSPNSPAPPAKSKWGVFANPASRPPPPTTNSSRPSKVRQLFHRNKPPKTFTYKGISSADYFAAHPDIQEEEPRVSTPPTPSAIVAQPVPTPPPSEATDSPREFPIPPHPRDCVAPPPALTRTRSSTQPSMATPPISPRLPPPSAGLLRTPEPADPSVITLRKRVPLSSLPAPVLHSNQPLLRKPIAAAPRATRNIDLTEALPDTAPSPRGSMFPDHILTLPSTTPGEPRRIMSVLRRVGSVKELVSPSKGPVAPLAIDTDCKPPSIPVQRRPTSVTNPFASALSSPSPSPNSTPDDITRSSSSLNPPHPAAPLPAGFKEGDDIPLSALWSMMNVARSHINVLPKSPMRLPRSPRSSTESYRSSHLNMSSSSLHTPPANLLGKSSSALMVGRHTKSPSYSSTPPTAGSRGGGPPPNLTGRSRLLPPSEPTTSVSTLANHTPVLGPVTTPLTPATSPPPTQLRTPGPQSFTTATSRRRAQSRPVPPPLNLPPHPTDLDYPLSSTVAPGPQSAPLVPPFQGGGYPSRMAAVLPPNPQVVCGIQEPADSTRTLSNSTSHQNTSPSATIPPSSMQSPTLSVHSRPSLSSSISTMTYVASPSQPAHRDIGGSASRRSHTRSRPTSSASFSSTTQSPHKQLVQFSAMDDDRIRDNIRMQLLDETTFDAMLKKSKFTLKVSLTPQSYAS
ncbi:hypothetical protein H4R33_001320 [Dimargaris cristalligena]|nr:hypothetical protein H4R33_001320 [Dimargaris cristalligena]